MRNWSSTYTTPTITAAAIWKSNLTYKWACSCVLTYNCQIDFTISSLCYFEIDATSINSWITLFRILYRQFTWLLLEQEVSTIRKYHFVRPSLGRLEISISNVHAVCAIALCCIVLCWVELVYSQRCSVVQFHFVSIHCIPISLGWCNINDSIQITNYPFRLTGLQQ